MKIGSSGFRLGTFPALAMAVLLFAIALPLQAQQITRVAVLDMARVLSAYPLDQDSIKNFEAKKAEIQAEIDARAQEIRELTARKNELEAVGATITAEHYGKEIQQKTTVLKEYAALRQNELDLLARAVSANLSFVQRLSSTIARVAEAEGYSLVFNLKPEDSKAGLVLWNSPSVDITDKVIQALATAR